MARSTTSRRMECEDSGITRRSQIERNVMPNPQQTAKRTGDKPLALRDATSRVCPNGVWSMAHTPRSSGYSAPQYEHLFIELFHAFGLLAFNSMIQGKTILATARIAQMAAASYQWPHREDTRCARPAKPEMEGWFFRLVPGAALADSLCPGLSSFALSELPNPYPPLGVFCSFRKEREFKSRSFLVY
jgi:hypothetical protein